MVCRIGDSEDVRRHFVALFVLVHLNHLIGINWKLLVRIDSDKKESRVSLTFQLASYVNKIRIITLSKIVQHASFVQVRKLSHVFDLIEFQRIHFFSGVDVHDFGLQQLDKVTYRIIS